MKGGAGSPSLGIVDCDFFDAACAGCGVVDVIMVATVADDIIVPPRWKNARLPILSSTTLSLFVVDMCCCNDVVLLLTLL